MQLQVPDLGQVHLECGRVKLVLRRQPYPPLGQ